MATSGYSPEQIRHALLAVRAKKFANHLRGEARGWAESIPEEDQEWLKDEEIPVYFEILRRKGLVQRSDRKWEAK